MTKRTRCCTQVALLLIDFLLSAPIVSAADQDFSRLVKEIESHFHVKRTHIALLGVAKPAVKLARSSSVKSLELAIFEEQDFSSDVDSTEFGSLIRKSLGQEWHSMVQVQSRRDNEQTYIFARDMGKDFKLLIVELEPNEAVVMLIRAKPADLVRWLDEPDQIGKAIEADLDEANQE
jgi:hypothetical protein